MTIQVPTRRFTNTAEGTLARSYRLPACCCFYTGDFRAGGMRFYGLNPQESLLQNTLHSVDDLNPQAKPVPDRQQNAGRVTSS